MKNLMKYWKIFIVSLLASFFTYSLMMTHQLVNNLDGLWHGSISYANGHELSIGRWFWRFLDMGRFWLSPDPITSIISLVLFAASFVLILDLLDAEDRVLNYIAAGIFMINVSVCVSLSYRFQSPTFAAACFLAALAAYITVKAKKRLVIYLSAPLSIALMLGLYQAYIGSFLLILAVYLAYRLYSGEDSIKDILRFVIRCAIVSASGGILYFILLKLNLIYYDVQMSSYNNADQYNLFGLIKNLPDRTVRCYVDFMAFYRNLHVSTNMFPPVIHMAFFIAALAVFAAAFIEIFKKSRVKAVLFVLCILLVPAACNSVLYAAYDSFTSIQMTFPMSMSIPVLVCLIGKIRFFGEKPQKICTWCVTGLICLILYGNYIMTVYDQQSMYMSLTSMQTISRQVTDALINEDLYHPYYQYCFVGTPFESPLFYKNGVYDKANSYTKLGNWDVTDTRSIVQGWTGYYNHIEGINLAVADDEKVKQAVLDPVVQQMPVFPEKGSCRIVNDVVVIKLAPWDPSSIDM